MTRPSFVEALGFSGLFEIDTDAADTVVVKQRKRLKNKTDKETKRHAEETHVGFRDPRGSERACTALEPLNIPAMSA